MTAWPTKTVLSAEASALSELANNKDIHDSIERVASLLCNARTIWTSGVGKSGIIAQRMAVLLASVGRPAHFLHPVEAVHGDIGAMEPGSVLVCVSASGTTSEVHALASLAVERECKVVAIVGAPTGSKSFSDEVVTGYTPHNEAWESIPTTSFVTASAVADAIAVGVAYLRGVDSSDLANHHPGGTLGQLRSG